MEDDDIKIEEQKIETEKKRLLRIYSKIDVKKKNTVVGLIERAAFIRVKLKMLEDDINIYGFTEWFSQGEQEPYKRQRPEAQIYCSLNTGYQKIIKQLSNLLPKEQVKTQSDGFDNFVSGRDG